MRPFTRLALAWSKRSTCSAALTLVIFACRAIWPGSLVRSVRSMRIHLLRWIHSYSSADPKMNEAVIGTSRSRASRRYSSSTPSLNISVQIRRPFCWVSEASTASGTAPMPSCRVEWSCTRAAISSPICRATSSSSPAEWVGRGSSTSTR